MNTTLVWKARLDFSSLEKKDIIMKPNILFRILFISMVVYRNNVICDNIIMKMMADFRAYCPYTETCRDQASNGTNSKALPFIAIDNLEPCCEPCSCESDCGMSCCPDTRTTLPSDDEVKRLNRMSCISAQYYYPNATDYRYNMFMFADCPESYNNTSVIDRCLRDYIDFNFTEPMFTFIPYSTDKMFGTYKNIYCALCQNVSLTDIVPWNMYLGCLTATSNLTLRTFQEIPDDLASRPDCFIFFTPPEIAIHSTKACDVTIDRCNVTGLWEDYDPFIEAACLSYKSEYVHQFNTSSRRYQNVHCALCNELSSPELSDVCTTDYGKKYTPLHPFTSLLNFNQPNESPETEVTHTCGKDTVFDKIQEKCLELHCADGMTATVSSNGIFCEPLYFGKLETDAMFHINYKMIPIISTFGPGHHDFESFHEIFQQSLTAQIRDSLGNTCGLTMDAILNGSLEDTVQSMVDTYGKRRVDVWKYVSYVDVRIHIAAKGLSNVIETLTEIANIIPINPIYTGKFNISFQAISNDERYIPNINVITPPQIAQAKNLKLTDYVLNRILDGYNDKQGRGVLQFSVVNSYNCLNPEYKQIEVWPRPLCCRIALPHGAYESDQFNNYLNNKIDASTTSSWVISDYDNTNDLVCYDDYKTFQEFLLSEQIRRQDNHVSDQETVVGWLSTVCIITSLVCLFITLCVYLTLPKLRTIPSLNNITLVLSLIIFQLSYVLSHSRSLDMRPWVCIGLAIIVHWSILVYAFWMFICIFHVSRMFASNLCVSSSLNLRKQFVRHMVFVLTIASVFVTVNIGVSLSSSGGHDVGYDGLPCYLNNARMVLYTVALPVGLAIIANIVLFTYTTITYCRLPNMSMASNQNLNKLKVLAKLFTLSGTWWVFGYLYQFTGVHAFSYLFIVFNAGQGLLVFVSFVLTRRVWAMMKERAGKELVNSEGSKTGVSRDKHNTTVSDM